MMWGPRTSKEEHPGKLSEMQILGPPRLPESDTQERVPAICLNAFLVTLKPISI